MERLAIVADTLVEDAFDVVLPALRTWRIAKLHAEMRVKQRRLADLRPRGAAFTAGRTEIANRRRRMLLPERTRQRRHVNQLRG